LAATLIRLKAGEATAVQTCRRGSCKTDEFYSEFLWIRFSVNKGTVWLRIICLTGLMITLSGECCVSSSSQPHSCHQLASHGLMYIPLG